MNTKSIDKEVFYNVTGEAVTAAYNYLNALGHFTTPTNEGRRVENLLIQARCQEMDVKKAIAGTYGKGYNPAAMEELVKALEMVTKRLATSLEYWPPLTKDGDNFLQSEYEDNMSCHAAIMKAKQALNNAKL